MRPLIRAAAELAIAGALAVAAATAATITAANYGGGQSGDLPAVNLAMVALVLLLPVTHGFTTLILPSRPRPALPRRAVAVPVVAPTRAPGTWMPAPARTGGARGAGAGIPQRPAAARLPSLTAAGPAVPGGVR